MNPPQVHCVPHPEPSSLLPPHSIPLGRPSAPAPSIQYHALNLDWQLISYMIINVFNFKMASNWISQIIYVCVCMYVDHWIKM